ncbi:probable LRR receptor-like serine/threonine-protein kinase At1g14390 isoform X2 [Daucus carota subsp. sativus]|uniref:probable LRR receptor-like serine/threonine-protein kinase At1g14390 isoform X2 n=1 Tax=Daucus carota subsp. sativus TaxID=79200 RepID=UPI003083ECC7
MKQAHTLNPLFFPLFFALFLALFLPVSVSQISPGEKTILFQLQRLLEYPPVLQGWNNFTSFCYLPRSDYLSIVCSGNHVTKLSITGNRTSRQILSKKFSTDSFFTTLTKLSSLKSLSLVSLGLWGPLPHKINRFWSLEVLNISSNQISGNIPVSISTLPNLKTLVLANNLLNGTVPDLKGLTNLENLDLGNNFLGPRFPAFGEKIVSLVLRNNSIRSEIPSVFAKLVRLQILDVSSNKLVGPIPPFVFSLQSIKYLNLAKNQLNGALSAQVSCSKNLVFVDISNNLLYGKLPSCIASSTANRTVISLWNCLSNTSSKYQRANSFCRKQAIAVKPPAKAKPDEESTMKLGLVLGIIGGIVGVVGALGVLFLIIFRRAQAKKSGVFRSDSFVFDTNPGLGSPKGDSRHKPQTMRRMATFGLPPYQNFTFDEMEEATNNFDSSNLVGEGAQGQVYKGWLRDGSTVIVRCLKVKQKHSTQTLKQHAEIVSKLRHRHLVSVLGHCTVSHTDHPSSASTVFIVQEYMIKGSLKDHLSDMRKREVLKWPQRMSIAMSVAKGIQFLHTELVPAIFGNDLKVDNILLDDGLAPKITNYKIPFPTKQGSESPLSNRHGTSNLQNSENLEKDDIFQFGVILLQLVTGKLLNSTAEIADMKVQLEMNLVESPATLREAVDPLIRGTFAYESLKTAVQISVNCLGEDSNNRPTIEDVLWHMQYSIQVQEGWTSSGNLSTKM